ncbi:MAG: phage/plasmid primase, P4 family [Pseudomonadota bacterium]
MKLEEDLTELGNAKLFCKIAEGNYKWLYEAKNWIVWEDNKWKNDNTGKINRWYEIILEYFSAKLTESNNEMQVLASDPDFEVAGSAVNVKGKQLKKEIAELYKWYLNSQSKRNITGSLELSRTQKDMTVTMAAVDNHSKMFGVKNGVVNITTGDLLTGDDAKGLYVMQAADVEYDEFATCDEWQDMVLKLMMGDKDVAKFLQTLLGSALVGHNSKYFTFFYGSGSNGKTTILEIVDRILGEYAITGDPDLFAKGTKKNKEYYFAMYHGKRLIVFNEIDKEMVNLSEDLIKQTTDSGQITARHPNGRPFDYSPQFTPIFSVNHLPNVSNDSAVWRRVVIVPFDYVVPDSEKEDDYIGRMVRDHSAGIFNWLLEGAREYLENGLTIPEKLKQFTNILKKETDVLHTFLLEYIGDDVAPEKVLAGHLRNKYVEWLSENGYKRAPTIRNFCTDLRAAGFEVRKSTGNQTYVFNLWMLEDGVNTKKIEKVTKDGVTDLTQLLNI